MKIERITSKSEQEIPLQEEFPELLPTDKKIHDCKIQYRLAQLGCILALATFPITWSVTGVSVIAGITAAQVYFIYKTDLEK